MTRTVLAPTAWTRDTLRDEDWLIHLGGRHTDLAALARRVALALEHGPGLALLRGWPGRHAVDNLDALYHDFGGLLGTPRAGGLTLVTQEPAVQERGGMSDKELAFHTDRAGPPGPPRLLGLFCVRAAVHGGDSLLVSGHSVYNRLARERPGALAELRRDFRFGASDGFDRVYPVFRWDEGRLRVQYNRYWIERGQREAGEPLAARTLAALDAFDGVLADPAMAVRVRLRPGDLLVMDNDVILHGRTAFTDAGGPGQGRCLARLWLD
ncbi:TauD/TfdA family dioxygenase [Nonomuraea sp. SYSU D8015]|uniref:TauD/TfdA family dioxygenase n=1 Tax=Nonomuraea sp. SYSU D8015 TaxID=2593644 RepID=UPI001660F6B3|nr:TauD/TfdA family dioxygenase [Nonomuraea sp. SYSU D8015]